MNWTAFSAISTFLAVLVALGISIFHHFYQNKVRLSVRLVTRGRYSEGKKTYIVISNFGMVPETITRILIRDEKGKPIELHHQDFDLPKTFRPHEVVHLDSPYLAHNLDKSDKIKIFAEDSSGKKWECEKESIIHSSKILRNFIGKRLTFPSMGDKINEDEIE